MEYDGKLRKREYTILLKHNMSNISKMQWWMPERVVFVVAFRVAIVDMGFMVTVRSVVALLSTWTCWVLVGL